MRKIWEVLSEGYNFLKEADIDSYRLDAQLILSHILKKDKIFLITNKEKYISEEEYEEYMSLIKLRKQRMPVKYILRECEFMGIDFYVEKGVLIPRPDTEILVEQCIKEIEKKDYKYICDMCCGSGAIGLSIAKLLSYTHVDLVDISEKAQKVTEFNINKLELKERATFVRSDLFGYVKDENFKYDMIVSNPPYIRAEEINDLMQDVKNYEPHIALDGGEDGLVFYRQIVTKSKELLNKNGILAFEIGYDQGEEVREIMEYNHFINIEVIKDLAGKDRVVIGSL